MEDKKPSVIIRIPKASTRYTTETSRTSRYPTEIETEFFRVKIAKRRALVAKQLEDWQAEIAKIPTPYKTLTEQEWLDACKHFNGCAFCHKPDVAARGMFIPFQLGGRYCSWNIVPSCEACAKAAKGNSGTQNPFARMETKLLMRDSKKQAKRLGQSAETLQEIVEYLKPILLEAANEKTVTD